MDNDKRAHRPVIIVLLAGFPNSGTTIASFVIGQHPRVFIPGELADFPDKQLKAGKICACGSEAAACTFWIAVARRLGKTADQPMPERLAEVYRAIADHSGASVIVDVAHDLHAVAAVFRAIADQKGLELRLVHLRRQGLAVLNSRMRRVNSPGHELPPGLAPRFKRAFRHVIRWRAFDQAIDRLRRTLGEQRAITVRYDTLCRQPSAVLAEIGRLAGLDFTDVGARLSAGEALTLMPHMIRGNPRLKGQTLVHLSPDDAFASELLFSDRIAYCAASAAAPALLAARRRKPIQTLGNPM